MPQFGQLNDSSAQSRIPRMSSLLQEIKALVEQEDHKPEAREDYRQMVATLAELHMLVEEKAAGRPLQENGDVLGAVRDWMQTSQPPSVHQSTFAITDAPSVDQCNSLANHEHIDC